MDKILMMVNEWDPIGFFPMAPEDEYINEYLNVSQNITEKKLAKKINEIFIMAFGSDVYVEDIEGCLRKIP